MKKFSKSNFVDHIGKLGLKAGARVVCHSSLFSFGLSKSTDLLDALTEVIGRDGTLVVPGYVFKETEPFNRLSTLPTNVGALSLDLFKSKQSIRSYCPIHNHIGIGPMSNNLILNDYSTSFGLGSDLVFV